MSVAFSTLHIHMRRLFTLILPSPSMSVYLYVYPSLSLSFSVSAARLLSPPQRAWLRHLAYKTADSIFKLHNQDKRDGEREGDRRTHLTNDVLVFEPAQLVFEC